MDFHLQGKGVIVTAASKGLGKAVAAEFAREGAFVLIGSRHAETLQETVDEIKELTGNVNIDHVACDVTKSADIEQMVTRMLDWTGRIDVLINNAGGPPAGKFMEMDDDDWQHALELNLLSVVRMIRGVVPHMQAQNGGHIVNLASSSIKSTLDNLVLSNTMRPGVLGLSKTLSQELAPDNILINTVGPGTVETDRITELHTKKAEQTGDRIEAVQDTIKGQIPMGRFGQPDEFARAVVFLASGANTYITGQSLLVDGGLLKALT